MHFIQKPKFLLYSIVIPLFFLMHYLTDQNLNYQLNSELSKEAKILYAFINKASRQIGEKYKMSPCGIGGGIENGIWLMSFSFQRYASELNEKQARSLLINSLHDYLELVNKDEEIRPYLKNYPFKAENIDMKIFNYDANREYAYHPYIALVENHEGKIGYFTEEKSSSYIYKSKKYETYDEAIAILEKERIRNL